MKRLIFVYISFFTFTSLAGQSVHKLKKEADAAYKNENYNVAEESYRKALDKKQEEKTKYNLGNTLYNQERYDEAQQYFEGAAVGLNGADKQKALFNKGNAYLKQEKYDESIAAYKEALKIDEKDKDILKNLSYAQAMKKMQKMQEQMQEQFDKQQEKREQNKDQEEKEQQQGEQQEGNQNQDQQEQQQESGEQKEEQNEDSEASDSGEEKKDLSKEEALKLLDIIEDEEQKVQEKLRKIDGNKKKPEKDW
jgi:tetratricopeptide (TPR) repeat protein